MQPGIEACIDAYIEDGMNAQGIDDAALATDRQTRALAQIEQLLAFDADDPEADYFAEEPERLAA